MSAQSDDGDMWNVFATKHKKQKKGKLQDENEYETSKHMQNKRVQVALVKKGEGGGKAKG